MMTGQCCCMLIPNKGGGPQIFSAWAMVVFQCSHKEAHQFAKRGSLTLLNGQESYATEQAAQLAHAVEKNSSTVFANVISKDSPVATSGTYLSVSIVQVRCIVFMAFHRVHNALCVHSTL